MDMVTGPLACANALSDDISDAADEIVNGFPGVAAATQGAQGGHARIVPTADQTLVHQLAQVAFAQDGVVKHQPRKLDLAGRTLDF